MAGRLPSNWLCFGAFLRGQQSQRDDAPTPLLDSTAMGTGAMLTRRVSWRALALHYPRGILGRNDRCGTPCSRFREHATQRKTWPTRSHWQDGHQYHRQFHLVAFTDRCSRATDHYSPVPRPTSGVRSCADPPPAGHCLTPTAELRKIEWARSGRADPLSYYAPNQAIPAEKSIRYSLLAAVGPFTFSHGRRRQRQSLQACLPDGHTVQYLFSACSP